MVVSRERRYNTSTPASTRREMRALRASRACLGEAAGETPGWQAAIGEPDNSLRAASMANRPD